MIYRRIIRLQPPHPPIVLLPHRLPINDVPILPAKDDPDPHQLFFAVGEHRPVVFFFYLPQGVFNKDTMRAAGQGKQMQIFKLFL